MTFTARGVSDGAYSLNANIECSSGCPTSTATNQTINDNHIPGAIYFDTSASYQISSGLKFYAAEDSIANKAPVQAGGGHDHRSRTAQHQRGVLRCVGTHLPFGCTVSVVNGMCRRTWKSVVAHSCIDSIREAL